MNRKPTSLVEVFRNRTDGGLLVLHYGINPVSKFTVGMGSLVEIPMSRIHEDAGREILLGLAGFPWPDVAPRCQLTGMTMFQRRKFFKLHESVMIHIDEEESGAMRIKALIPVGASGGAMSDPSREKLLRPPFNESAVIRAVLSVFDMPMILKKKTRRKK